ncbi:hypothetical protein EGR_05147 [Echinococcus granulosus]|uniref:Uncharacterized protein n=1 Tax=Echinococcus granulosus TaxID=6210 RepID=W6UG88_ECHGR|nr:hypothetical protein EGR_05147 [Echinococcus granulosus]EUB59986.1 hypothetical protein EGR_05147 [Echinococcus granulosus]
MVEFFLFGFGFLSKMMSNLRSFGRYKDSSGPLQSSERISSMNITLNNTFHIQYTTQFHNGTLLIFPYHHHTVSKAEYCQHLQSTVQLVPITSELIPSLLSSLFLPTFLLVIWENGLEPRHLDELEMLCMCTHKSQLFSLASISANPIKFTGYVLKINNAQSSNVGLVQTNNSQSFLIKTQTKQFEIDMEKASTEASFHGIVNPVVFLLRLVNDGQKALGCLMTE